MNEQTKMYIPYGAAVLGGFVGNWLFAKYPKFGMIGKLVAIAGGVAGGYYISKYAMGEKIEMPFKNATNEECSGQCSPMVGVPDASGGCLCSQTRRQFPAPSRVKLPTFNLDNKN